MKKVIKDLSFLICVCFIIICTLSLSKKEKQNYNTPIRDVFLDSQEIDYESHLETYEDNEFVLEGNVGTFTGRKQLKDIDLSFLDLVSDIELTKEEETTYIDFEFKYNCDNSKVMVTTVLYDDGEEIKDQLVGVVFVDDYGNTDALVTLDDGSQVLLSEITGQYLDNCGWLSKLFKAVVSAVVCAAAVAVMAVLPVTIPALVSVTVAAATAAATYGVISATDRARADKNYEHNKTLTQPKDYVIGQFYLTDWKYGVSTVDQKGCGVMAAYNVLHGLGKHEEFAKVIYEFDYNTGTLASGIFGTDPSHYVKYFESKGLKCKKYSSIDEINEGLKKDDKVKMVLIGCWVGDTIFEGAHYFSCTYEPNDYYQLSFHNYNTKLDCSFFRHEFTEDLFSGDIITALIIS